MDALAWLEQTRLSAFVREDFFAYFVLLIFHAWGMAFLVGGGIGVSLRVMGVASKAPLARFRTVFAWMKFGAVMAIISGIGLLSGYPAKALTNWVFALKLACLIAAALLLRHIVRTSFDRRVEPPGIVRIEAFASLVLWLAGVAAGKLLLYTNSMLMTTDAVFANGGEF